MKKTRVLTTILAVAMMVICMCSMVFGLTTTRFLAGRSVGSTIVCAEANFYQSKTKYCILQPYYKSITCDGTCTTYLYKIINGSRKYYDKDSMSIKAKTTSGFYTSSIYADAGYYYEPAIRCDGGTTMTLNYLQVRYD